MRCRDAVPAGDDAVPGGDDASPVGEDVDQVFLVAIDLRAAPVRACPGGLTWESTESKFP